MQLLLYQVDAFTDHIFGGNPAAVVPLESWLPAATMQAIATENNLSETAFFVAEGEDTFGLRWFTPVAEIDLAGHPTLATAYVIFRFIKPAAQKLTFRTMKAGTLVVTRHCEELAMDFPARPPEPCALPPTLVPALGKRPVQVLGSRDYMAVYDSAADVAALTPDFGAIAKLDRMAVIATAPGEGDIDFVSRFFAPAHNINEDPVTGSAHCTLIPYWAGRLGKTRLKARQISARIGDLSCEHRGARVTIAGRCVLYMEGAITL
ncbi:MAG TPA: PhzF family phenazine biosynthesis protein [Stellaceae bacterium]|nr:PhzF family phenazine biosynthesis protein [Stellaceae bacterium]